MSRVTLGSLLVLVLATGCGLYGGRTQLVDLRRVAGEDIASERYRALFLAGVEQAEWSLDMGDPETAGNILNGLSYLAYETRAEISAEGAIGTITAVHGLNRAGTLQGALAGRIVPVAFPNFACDVIGGGCDIPDTSQICYQLYSLPDTLYLGCVSAPRPQPPDWRSNSSIHTP